MSRVFLSSPDVGETERAAVLAAVDSGWIAPVGPHLNAFEEALSERTGREAVALSSGTAALHLALLAVGVQPGDDVLVSTFTFIASSNAISYCGANPVFIDSERETWNLSPSLVEAALAEAAAGERLPAAVVAVDLYGQCANYRELAEVCTRYGVPLVEDAAPALGATHHGQPAGSFGDLAILSFNGNKVMTTSGGGALLTPHTDVADRVRYLSTQARQPGVGYEHTEVGYNYRLSNLLAAIGTAQLDRLPAMIDRRLAIHAVYRGSFSKLPVQFMPVPDWNEWNGWLTCVVFDETETRDRVMAGLAELEIESRPLWKPLHLQPVHSASRSYVDGTSEDLAARGLCLPNGSSLTDAEVERVIAGVGRSI